MSPQRFIGLKFLEEMKLGKNRQSRTPQNNNSKLSLSVSSLDQLTHSLASKLKSLVYEQPIECNGGLSVYEAVRKDHDYVVTVDVARGVGEDFSAFIVVDITEFPHRVVAKVQG